MLNYILSYFAPNESICIAIRAGFIYNLLDMNKKDRKNITIPHIGRRIIKTTVAVFICLLVCYLLGFRGAQMPSEACITAIICMQPLVRDTRQYAINRVIGTLIGSVWGLLLLLLLTKVPAAGSHMAVLYLLMAVGTMLSIYTAVLLGKNDTSGLAAIVFLCIVIAFPEIDEPLKQAGLRILNVFIGTAVAIAVNTFRLPRRKDDRIVFFVRTKDLVSDRFSQMDPAVQFRFNRLCLEGARISLVSEHAPAFFAMQLGQTELNTPMIVMDGAAIYNTKNNSFLWTAPIEKKSLEMLISALGELGFSYFTYTVHNNRTSIFHTGEYSEAEGRVLDRMKRSPYRDYLSGDLPADSEVVYVKIVADDDRIGKVSAALHRALPERRYRMVVRAESGVDGVSSLYVYDSSAVPGHARAVLMNMLNENGSPLEFDEPVLKNGYRGEGDALRLLSGIEKKFEPTGF